MNIVPTALNAPSETVSCLWLQLLLPDHWQFRLKALIQPDRFCPLTTDKASHFIHLIIRDSDDSTLNKSDGSTKLNYALKQKWLSWRYDRVRNGPPFYIQLLVAAIARISSLKSLQILQYRIQSSIVHILVRYPHTIHIFFAHPQPPQCIIFNLTYKIHYIMQFLKVDWHSYTL